MVRCSPSENPSPRKASAHSGLGLSAEGLAPRIAARGHATVALPNKAINSRRLIPLGRGIDRSGLNRQDGSGQNGGSAPSVRAAEASGGLSPETAKLIEDVSVDNKGRLIPRLYSKSEAPDVTKLSDAELIAQLAQMAKELGIEIDLNYSFAQPKKTDE